MPEQKPVICLMGPTAVGKSSLALTLAKRYHGELVSVDSTLIYRGMTIGTAKPSLQEQAEVPHHLIDIIDPNERYSTAQFCQDALAAIASINSRGRLAILVGGTMLYFRALQQGLSELPPADEKIRAQLTQRLQQEGSEALHQELRKIDPQSAERIHPHDPQRLQRALEVFYLSGKTLTELTRHNKPFLTQAHVNIALLPEDRLQLHQVIAKRFTAMLEAGFVDEVRQLLQQWPLTLDAPALRSVGYRQIYHYLHNEYDYDEMKEKSIAATRQLAKRQLTWLRRWPELISAMHPQAVIDYLDDLLK